MESGCGHKHVKIGSNNLQGGHVLHVLQSIVYRDRRLDLPRRHLEKLLQHLDANDSRFFPDMGRNKLPCNIPLLSQFR
jgi:hypothetical protein